MKRLFNNIKLILTIFLCKIIIKICRLINSGGTTLPGKMAIALYPDILKVVTKDFKIIGVTGTNGKTTTTNIIAKIFDKAGIKYISNNLGANLVSGITTAIVSSLDWQGKTDADYALLEIDEGVFAKITSHFKLDIIIVTNFFSDQVERFGGILKVVEGVKSTITKCDDASLVLNGDDPFCVFAGEGKENRTIFFGVSNIPVYFDNTNTTTEEYGKDKTDATLFCLNCGNKYEYSYHTYEHLGEFKCTKCGFQRPGSHVSLFDIEEMNDKYSIIKIQTTKDNWTVKINLPGVFNIYNTLAAIALSEILEIPEKPLLSGLSDYEPAFGRMNEIIIDGQVVKIVLVKNPSGFNQIINWLLKKEELFQIAFLINNKPGDDRDISWIQDVHFEKLVSIEKNINNILVAGTENTYVTKRLSEAGITSSKIEIFKSYNYLIEKGLSDSAEKKTIYILSTYTAMLEIKKILRKKYRVK